MDHFRRIGLNSAELIVQFLDWIEIIATTRSVSHFFYHVSYSKTTWQYCLLDFDRLLAKSLMENTTNELSRHSKAECKTQCIYKSLQSCPSVAACIFDNGTTDVLSRLLYHLTNLRSVTLWIGAYLKNPKQEFDLYPVFNHLKESRTLEKLTVQLDFSIFEQSLTTYPAQLKINGNYLIKLIDSCGRTAIKQFECQGCDLSYINLEGIASAFPNLTSLKLLDIQGFESERITNEKQFDLPKLLERLPKLKKLQLFIGLVKSAWLADAMRDLPINLMQQLTELHLDNCNRFDKANYETLNKMTALETLYLNFHARIDEQQEIPFYLNLCLRTLSQHPTLPCFHLVLLGQIDLYNEYFEHIAKMKNLKVFKLLRNRIQRFCSDDARLGDLLRPLQQIKSLTLNKYQTVKSIVEILNSLPNLEDLLVTDFDPTILRSSFVKDLVTALLEQEVTSDSSSCSNNKYKNLKYLQVGDVYRRWF